jgi:hypothetical protein
VGLERGPLSLVGTTEELLGRKSSGSGPENRDYGRRGSAANEFKELVLNLPVRWRVTVATRVLEGEEN